MEAKEQVFTKREIVGNLRALTKTAIELTRLLREDSKLLEPVAHSRRNLKELLLHLALIPREQILMLRGIERETISQGYAINSIKDFEKILSASVDFFVTEIKSVDLNRQYITPKKKKMSGLSWGIEALTHFTAHRDQVYLHLMSQKIVPPRALLGKFFATHPEMSTKTYAELRKKQKSGSGLKALPMVVKKYKKEQPLRNKKILVCTHFKSAAIEFVLGLQTLGAKVYYHPIQYSKDSLVLQDMSLLRGITLIEGDKQLQKILPSIDIILEDGARLSKLILAMKPKPKLPQNIFAIEQTTHGLLFWSTEDSKKIPYPVVSVANSQIKMHIENTRATPESILNQFLKTTGASITGKRILILGYGMIGSGLASLLRDHGAKITILESFPVRRLISASHGYETHPPEAINKIVSKHDIIISCTNAYSGTSLKTEQFLLMKNGTTVFNGGSGNGEIAEEMISPGVFTRNDAEISIAKANDDILCTLKKGGEEKHITILAGAHPLNLRNGEGTSSDVIDFVFSLMLLGALKTNPKHLSRRVHTIDQSMENELAKLLEEDRDGKDPEITHIKKRDLKPSARPYGSVSKFGPPGVLQNFSIARAVFKPKSETRGHYHLNSEEGYFIEQGSADITMWHLDEPNKKKIIPVKQGDYLTIPKGVVHHVRTTSATDFVILVVASPPFSFWDQFFLDEKS